MKSVKDLLDCIRERAQVSFDKGQWFEQIIKAVFEQDSYYKDRFSKVWLWKDYPERDGGDTGIDLVAKQTDHHGGGLCAIQCKFYDSGNIPNSDINKFLAKAGPKYTDRILVATGGYSKTSHRKLQDNFVSVITGNDLAEIEIESDQLVFTKPDRLEIKTNLHKPRYHQKEAINKVTNWFASSQTQGRLLMPCGTGKSLTALWLAEKNVGAGGRLLYLVPSIALMSQTMKVFSSQKSSKQRYIGICSDRKTGKSKDDITDLTELLIPVTTDIDKIGKAFSQDSPDCLTVVFSTYQSLSKICQVQAKTNIEFDLIICDEAHRTTGLQKLDDSKEDANSFLLVHDQDKLKAKKRLYMTATQRIYTPAAKQKAKDRNIDFYSMDDSQKYGDVIYEMKFDEAVNNGLLSDYKVIVIAYDAKRLQHLQNQYSVERSKNIGTDDYLSMIGLWDALSAPNTDGLEEEHASGVANKDHCRQGIVFTNSIKKSRLIEEHWPNIVNHYIKKNNYWNDKSRPLRLEIDHVDGGMNAQERGAKLERLKQRPDFGEARLLTNARCLSEGVDVPSLDAVLFVDPKSSEIDIVQSVGRVMRKSDDKDFGYIILPVIVPQDRLLRSADFLKSSNFCYCLESLKSATFSRSTA